MCGCGGREMTDNELIRCLRDWAAVEGPGTAGGVLNEAADRIEALSERVDIMSAEMER